MNEIWERDPMAYTILAERQRQVTSHLLQQEGRAVEREHETGRGSVLNGVRRWAVSVLHRTLRRELTPEV